jgi:hypothetical protein
MMVGSVTLVSLATTGLSPEFAGGQAPRESVYASSGSNVSANNVPAGSTTANPSGHFQTAAGGSLVAHFAAAAGGPHTVTVIDPQRQVLGVYHVDAASGAITLMSVRNLSWDLQMAHFNNEGLLPQDVRGGLRSASGVSGAISNSQRVRTTETEVSRRGPIAAPPGG